MFGSFVLDKLGSFGTGKNKINFMYVLIHIYLGAVAAGALYKSELILCLNISGAAKAGAKIFYLFWMPIVMLTSPVWHTLFRLAVLLTGRPDGLNTQSLWLV